jgi:hypothetical protein
MPNRCLQLVAVVCLVPAPAAAADDGPAQDSGIPLVGRPADLPFSGASGQFRVEARAEPTALRAGESLTFTLTVRATGPVRQPPDRLDLSRIPAFAGRFFIDPGPTESHPDAGSWEFAYRLKPRRPDVSEVPGLPFVYFNPAIRQAEKAYQIAFTDPVPLSVRPAEEYVPLPPVPDAVYELATGPGVLARERPPGPPGPVVLSLLLASPPLACAAWYAVWRRRHPDASRRGRRRHSRAAQRSLKSLRGARRLAPPERAVRAAGAVTSYLRERFELSATEPTPAEAAQALRRAGCAPPLAEAASRFIAACDAARFAPAPGADGLAGEAARLILEVEAETWASRRC